MRRLSLGFSWKSVSQDMNRSNVDFPPETSSAGSKQPVVFASRGNVVELNVPKEKPAQRTNSIDVHVGGRLRMKRLSCGLSEQALAAAAGVSVAHLHRLETGALRIDARLFADLARILHTPPSYFFKKWPREIELPSG
jgi:ribosome-binding protein aMBF1 (putative translation factor)